MLFVLLHVRCYNVTLCSVFEGLPASLDDGAQFGAFEKLGPTWRSLWVCPWRSLWVCPCSRCLPPCACSRVPTPCIPRAHRQGASSLLGKAWLEIQAGDALSCSRMSMSYRILHGDDCRC